MATGQTPYQLDTRIPDSPFYAVFPLDDAIPELRRFRSQWILLCCQRPVVPVLRGPLPHRGVTDKVKRAKLMCVYLRPWVMLRSRATSHVPHLADLDRVYWRVSDEGGYPGLLRRTRLAISARSGDPRATPAWATRSYYRAWRHYIRGNIVSDYGAQIIKNFLLVMAGAGKVEHEEDELNGGRVRREDLGDPGMRLGVAEIRTLLQATPQSVTAVDEKQNAITNRINSAMAVVRRLLQPSDKVEDVVVSDERRASNHRELPRAQAKGKAKAKAAPQDGRVIRVEIYRRNWKKTYAAWEKRLRETTAKDGKPAPPYEVQWKFMHTSAAFKRQQRNSRGR